jgi:hypothetical protein
VQIIQLQIKASNLYYILLTKYMWNIVLKLISTTKKSPGSVIHKKKRNMKSHSMCKSLTRNKKNCFKLASSRRSRIPRDNFKSNTVFFFFQINQIRAILIINIKLSTCEFEKGDWQYGIMDWDPDVLKKVSGVVYIRVDNRVILLFEMHGVKSMSLYNQVSWSTFLSCAINLVISS